MIKMIEERKIKAEALEHFADMLIGAFESGFLDGNTFTISEIYTAIKDHTKDNYGVEIKSLQDKYGEKMAESASAASSTEIPTVLIQNQINHVDFLSKHFPKIAQEFISECIRFGGEARGLKDISDGFTWSKSKRGHCFWSEIYDCLCFCRDIDSMTKGIKATCMDHKAGDLL